jgi:DNA-binding HxlR family transcriptional regulator
LGIARNVLASRLKTLVDDGLLERRRYRKDPDRQGRLRCVRQAARPS